MNPVAAQGTSSDIDFRFLAQEQPCHRLHSRISFVRCDARQRLTASKHAWAGVCRRHFVGRGGAHSPSSMPPAMLPHQGRVQLKRGLLTDYLLHNCTGEFAALARRGTLAFDDEGFGFVQYGDQHESDWVDDVLSLWAFKDDEDQRLKYRHKDSDELTPLDDLLLQAKQSKVFGGAMDGQQWFCETMHTVVPIQGSRIRWCAPAVLKFIFGEGYSTEFFHSKKRFTNHNNTSFLRPHVFFGWGRALLPRKGRGRWESNRIGAGGGRGVSIFLLVPS